MVGELDATFMKHFVGGALLAAYVKDGNDSIMIVTIFVIVSTENEDS